MLSPSLTLATMCGTSRILTIQVLYIKNRVLTPTQRFTLGSRLEIQAIIRCTK